MVNTQIFVGVFRGSMSRCGAGRGTWMAMKGLAADCRITYFY